MRPIEGVLAVLLALGFYTLVAAQEALKPEAAGMRLGDAVGVTNPTFAHAELEQMAQGQRVCLVAVATIRSRVVTGTEVAKGCESAQEPETQPIFQAASLGKPVFAYAVIKLAQQGRIDLDAPLMWYLPQGYAHVQNPGDDIHPPRIDAVVAPELQSVTARRVLNHTSGLPNWSRGPLEFDFRPGARWQYSGEAYVLLQTAVEAITGVRLDAFMREQVFAPLGMEHSDYAWSQRLESGYVPGTTAHGRSLALRHFRAPVAAYSLYTSAQDYARFVAALLSDAPALLATQGAPARVEPSLGLDWGLGWGMETASNGDQFIWHWGNNPGYRAFVMASVQSGDGVVMLTSGENGLALAEPIVQAALPGPHKTFQFSRIPNGFEHFVCRTLGLCF